MRWWRPVVAGTGLVALVALVVVVAWVHGIPGPADLRRMTVEAGPWAPVLFVGLQAGLCVAPVPRTVFTLAAGLLFGSVLGLVLTLVGTVLAAVLAYAVVRATGGRLVERYVRGSAVRWARTRLDHHGTLAVTSMRLVPLIPFAGLNYVCGLSAVRLVPYLVGTVVGIVPGTVAIVVLGDAVTGRPSPALIAASVACGIVGLAGIVVAARRPIPADATPGAAGPGAAGPGTGGTGTEAEQQGAR